MRAPAEIPADNRLFAVSNRALIIKAALTLAVAYLHFGVIDTNAGNNSLCRIAFMLIWFQELIDLFVAMMMRAEGRDPHPYMVPRR